jgi:hypothetical protein
MMDPTLARDNGLFDAVEQAAESFPVAWQRAPGELTGRLEGRHAAYSISIRSPHPNWLWIRVAIDEQPDLDRRPQIELLCMAANRRFPTGGFHLPPGEDARVHASAAIRLGRSQEPIEPAVVRNTLRRCVLDAELFAPMLRKINHGSVIVGALAAGSDAFIAMRDEPDGIPNYLSAHGAPPANDVRLVDACEEAARATGWATLRRTPTQIMVDTDRRSAAGPVVTFIDAHDGLLIASAYAQDENVPSPRRPAVSQLLNHILSRNAPFGLALDLDSGAVSALSSLDFSGAKGLPPQALLCDLIEQATEGAERFGGSIQRVAHDDVPPEWALAEVGTAQHGAPTLERPSEALALAAQKAAAAIPAIWQHREPGWMQGMLQGRNGLFSVDMMTLTPGIFLLQVASGETAAPDRLPEIAMLCMELNRTLPTGGLRLSAKLEGAVISSATLRLERSERVPEPALLENLLRQTILNAELVTPMITDVNSGRPVSEAIERGIERFAANHGTAQDISRFLRFAAGPPTSDEALSEACEAACQAAGSRVLRRSPHQIIVSSHRGPTGNIIATFVDAEHGNLYASTYLLDQEQWVPPKRRPAVAQLLNAILDLGVPYGLALDLDTGNVRSRGFLSLRGLPTMPPPGLLCDVIAQSAMGATVYIDAITRTAHSDVDPIHALRDSEAARIAQRRAS